MESFLEEEGFAPVAWDQLSPYPLLLCNVQTAQLLFTPGEVAMS